MLETVWGFFFGLKYGTMDRDEFKKKTQHWLRFSPRNDREVLVKSKEPRDCEYCDKQVVNQTIVAEVYRLGTPWQHFRHKCKSCNCFVFDASAANPYEVRGQTRGGYVAPSGMSYVPTPSYSVNGKRMGRPPKPRAERVIKPFGRPRKPQP